MQRFKIVEVKGAQVMMEAIPADATESGVPEVMTSFYLTDLGIEIPKGTIPSVTYTVQCVPQTAEGALHDVPAAVWELLTDPEQVAMMVDECLMSVRDMVEREIALMDNPQGVTESVIHEAPQTLQ